MFNHIIPAPLEPASSPGRSSGTGHPDTQRIIRNCLTEAHLCLHAHHTLDLTAACYIWSPSPASGTLEKCPVLSKPDDRIFMTLSVTKKKKKGVSCISASSQTIHKSERSVWNARLTENHCWQVLHSYFCCFVTDLHEMQKKCRYKGRCKKSFDGVHHTFGAD